MKRLPFLARRSLVAALLPLQLLGCSLLMPPPSKDSAAEAAAKCDCAARSENADGLRPPSRAESLLTYFEYAKALGPAEWTKEAERLRQVFAKDRSDSVRLQYALLLAVPNGPQRDPNRALQLAEPIVNDGKSHDTGVRELAHLLVSELAERRRLDENLQAANQKYKDEQARATELETKLEALKAIEKTLSRRERKPPGQRPGAQSTHKETTSE